MAAFTDSLRGYAFKIHERGGFKCKYCGLDGARSVAAWLSLSLDHLLPVDDHDRDNERYQVTACQFCNTADNRYFDRAKNQGFSFDNKSPEKLIAGRRMAVMKTRMGHEKFWVENVKEKL